MSDALAIWLGSAILVFCRVGACIMLMPGIGTIRVPPQVRVFIALAVSLALLPMCADQIPSDFSAATFSRQASVLLSEVAIGALIGFLARIFFLTLHFTLMLIATLIGFPVGSTMSMFESEPSTPLADAVVLVAILAFFSTNGHIEMFRTLLQSYVTMPVSQLLDTRFAANEISRLLSVTFLLAMQMAAPFVIYSLALNFLMGVAARMAPQMPMQFIGAPIILFGGLLLFGYLALPLMSQFNSAFGRWLSTG